MGKIIEHVKREKTIERRGASSLICSNIKWLLGCFDERVKLEGGGFGKVFKGAGH